MNNKLASFACIVSASKADLIQYWVMASPPQQAVSAVQLMLGVSGPWQLRILA
jgi:hypothetical protein